MARCEVGADGEEYHVQRVSAGQKDYRCPGCAQIVKAGTGHVVAWRIDSIYGQQANLEGRRHWHTHCWQRKLPVSRRQIGY